MSRRLLAILALLAVAFAILTVLAVRNGILAPQTQQTAAVGGPFQLTDQNGRTVDQAVLKGKWTAVFFGFTFCPEACPTTLFKLGQVEKQLAGDAKDFQTVFISVDPERDSVQQMKTYVGNDAFPQRIVALTGDAAQVSNAARAYRVFYQKNGTGPDYVIDHSTITYLMNPRGELACVLRYDEGPDAWVQRIRAAMKQGSRAQSC